jgi:hypothetical protein
MCYQYTLVHTLFFQPNERRLTAKPTSSCIAPKRQPTIGVSIFRGMSSFTASRADALS